MRLIKSIRVHNLLPTLVLTLEYEDLSHKVRGQSHFVNFFVEIRIHQIEQSWFAHEIWISSKGHLPLAFSSMSNLLSYNIETNVHEFFCPRCSYEVDAH